MLSKIFFAASAGAIAVLWFQNWRLNNKVASLETLYSQERAANKANTETIDDLIEQRNAAVREQQIRRDSNERAVEALNADIAALRARRPQVIREEVYRDPSCEQLGSIDIAAACPALASGVRRRAAGF